MGGLLSSLYSTESEPTAEDKTMASLVIPVLLEKNLALGDGSTEGGCPVATVLKFDQEEVANLYKISEGEFKFSFQEHGVAYNETTATDSLVEATLQVVPGAEVGFSLAVDLNPVQVWGINFAGKVLVKHRSGEEREIYLPGTRTYDPAGRTGTYECGLFGCTQNKHFNHCAVWLSC
jgi:hypothetical protein